MKKLLTTLLCAVTIMVSAQCPIITMPSTLAFTNCAIGQSITATANYSANITSRWLAPGNIILASSGGATSTVHLNYITTFTVEFTDTISKCVVTNTIQTTATNGKPVFMMTSPQNFTLGCSNYSVTTINISNASATGTDQVPNGGPVTFTLIGPGTFTSNSSYTINACGAYTMLVRDNNNSCASSYEFIVTCTKLAPLTSLSVSPNVTICPGSSVLLSASGVNSYSWSNGQISPSITVTPSVPTVYSVKGFGSDNCYQTTTVSIGLHSTCVGVFEEMDVWKNLSVFPNPATHEIALTGLSNKKTNYEFYDASGRLVLKGQLAESNRIQLHTLSAGSYLVKLTQEDSTHHLKIAVYR